MIIHNIIIRVKQVKNSTFPTTAMNELSAFRSMQLISLSSCVMTVLVAPCIVLILVTLPFGPRKRVVSISLIN